MPAIATLMEDNGVKTGNVGATRTPVIRTDWKSVDDTTTAYNNASVRAGENSFIKNNFIAFTGTFNKISNIVFTHTSGTLTTGVQLIAKSDNEYVRSVSSMTGTDFSAVDTSLNLRASTQDPSGDTSDVELTAHGFTQYIKTQLQTTTSAQPGDTSELGLKVQWDEN